MTAARLWLTSPRSNHLPAIALDHAGRDEYAALLVLPTAFLLPIVV